MEIPISMALAFGFSGNFCSLQELELSNLTLTPAISYHGKTNKQIIQILLSDE